MSEDNSNVVPIVGIVAIILLVAVALYFFVIAGDGGSADIEIDLPDTSSVPAAVDFAPAPDTVPMGVRLPV